MSVFRRTFPILVIGLLFFCNSLSLSAQQEKPVDVKSQAEQVQTPTVDAAAEIQKEKPENDPVSVELKPEAYPSFARKNTKESTSGKSEKNMSYLYMKMVLVLSFIVGIIFALSYLAKKMGLAQAGFGKAGFGKAGQDVKVLGKFSLTPKALLILIEWNHQKYLLGVTEQSVTVLDMPQETGAPLEE